MIVATGPVMADLLSLCLGAAVPLYIGELQQLHGETRARQIRRWAGVAGDAVAYRGDVLQYGGGRGEAADVFNQLARGLAVLAHAPGGVLFNGQHWCVEHRTGCPARSIADLSCRRDGFDTDDRPVTQITVKAAVL